MCNRLPKPEFSVLEESDYKPDFELNSKYEAFAQELLRLSLLSIGTIGFLFEKLCDRFKIATTLWLVELGLVCLIFSSGMALLNRILNISSMNKNIYYLRAKKNNADTAIPWKSKRDLAYQLCLVTLSLSGVCLIVGVLFLLYAFIKGINLEGLK